MKYFLFLLLSLNLFSQEVSGDIVSENGFYLRNVLVVNLSNSQKTFSDEKGHFSISATVRDEIRFVKEKYERVSIVIDSESFSKNVNIKMPITPTDIEEVVIIDILTGNLKKDANSLTKVDSKEKLNKDIGLPRPIEKPRPRPAELTKDVFVPMLLGNFNFQALYDIISGDARRLRSWYKYEDMQSNIKWIRERISDEYFNDYKIPKLKINEFLEFSILANPNVLKYIQANNIEGVILSLEIPIKEYVSRLEKDTSKKRGNN